MRESKKDNEHLLTNLTVHLHIPINYYTLYFIKLQLLMTPHYSQSFYINIFFSCELFRNLILKWYTVGILKMEQAKRISQRFCGCVYKAIHFTEEEEVVHKKRRPQLDR